MLRQLLYWVAPLPEPALVPVDVGDAGPAGTCGIESWVEGKHVEFAGDVFDVQHQGANGGGQDFQTGGSSVGEGQDGKAIVFTCLLDLSRVYVD